MSATPAPREQLSGGGEVLHPWWHGGNRTRTGLTVLWWSALLVLIAYFLISSALPYLHWDPLAYKRYSDRAGWLLIHIIGGMFALLIGPLQFWTAFRRRMAPLHRTAGRVYLGSIVISSAAALVLASRTQVGWPFGAALALMSCAWLGSSAMALWAIRVRQIAQHREWMIRSYVVTFGFVNFRLLENLLAALQVGSGRERVTLASWLCWTIPLAVTEMVIQGMKIAGGRPRANHQQGSSSRVRTGSRSRGDPRHVA